MLPERCCDAMGDFLTSKENIFLTSKENIVINLLFAWLGESRFNRTLSEYQALAARVPKVEALLAYVNERLAKMAKAGEVYKIKGRYWVEPVGPGNTGNTGNTDGN